MTEDDVRSRLIEAGSSLFAERGYRGTSMRAVARQAGVSPAMVAYYFDGKAGLLDAVLDSVFAGLFAEIQKLAAGTPGDGLSIERFIDVYLRALTSRPWIPHFIVREVLSENTPVRQRFIDSFASRAAAVVPVIFRQQIDAGVLRHDLDPTLALLSLLGMCVFPLIAQPVVGPLLGYELSPDFTCRLIAHTRKLYLEGAGAPS